MPRIGSFGLSIRGKYKLELNHVIRVAVNKHVFGETKFTYLRVTSMCSQKNSAGRNKTWPNERQGSKLTLETIAFYSDSFVARKINVEQKVAENWARPRTGPHTVAFIPFRMFFNRHLQTTRGSFLSGTYRIEL